MLDKLTAKQRLFVDAYIGIANGNATKAARLAGYAGDDKTLCQVGYENLRKPVIEEVIERRFAENAMSAKEVVSRLTDQARASLEDFFNFDRGTVRLDIGQGNKRGKMHLLKSYSESEKGTRIEMVDSQAALEKLGRFHKLFTDKTELSADKEILRLFTEMFPSDEGSDASEVPDAGREAAGEPPGAEVSSGVEPV